MKGWIAAALLLTGAAPPQTPEPIAGEVLSWGKTLKAFEVTPDGEVRYSVSEEEGHFLEYWLVTRRARIGPDAYRRIARLTAEARALNGKSWDCRTGPTDGPYGSLRWGGEHIDFNSSCIAAETDTVASAIYDALALAGEWAGKSEIVSREWKGTPKAMIRKLDETISVAPQIAPEDVADIAAAGFVAIVNNRPDGEEYGQPDGAAIRAAAEAAGLAYTEVPVTHAGLSANQVEAMADFLAQAGGPVLAYCRSGTRSCNLWALAAASQGGDPAELVGKGASAGYDLSGIRPMLDMLAGRA